MIKQNLKKLRIAAKISQTRLAERAKLPTRNISDWESGLHLPNAKGVALLCYGLRCSADELLFPELIKVESPLQVVESDLEIIRRYQKLDVRGKRVFRALLNTQYIVDCGLPEPSDGESASAVVDDTVGGRICFLRKQKGLTQEDLAKAIGVTRSSILKYESNKVKPKSSLTELAKFFDVTESYILNGTGFSPKAFNKDTGKELRIAEKYADILAKIQTLSERGKLSVTDFLERELALAQVYRKK